MPVTDIQTHHYIVERFSCLNMDVSAKKQEAAAKLLLTKRWQDQIRHTLRNTRWNFRLFFGHENLNERSNATPKILSESDDYKIPCVSDHITFVMTHNITTKEGFMPVTGWIVIHRLLHALDWNDYDEFCEIYEDIQEIYREAYQLSDEKKRWQVGARVDAMYEGFPSWLCKILTMKSARDGKLRNFLDLFAEMGCQYVINKKITLNPIPRTFNGWKMVSDEALMNDMFQELVRAVEKQYDEKLKNIQGKVVVM